MCSKNGCMKKLAGTKAQGHRKRTAICSNASRWFELS